MNTQEKLVIELVREILVHVNGYSREQCTDEFVLENEGSDIWEAIENVVKKYKI